MIFAVVVKGEKKMARYIDANNINFKGVAVFSKDLEALIPLSDVRKATLQTVFLDCIVEFNVGAGIIFELWRFLLPKKERDFIVVGNEHIKG